MLAAAPTQLQRELEECQNEIARLEGESQFETAKEEDADEASGISPREVCERCSRVPTPSQHDGGAP